MATPKTRAKAPSEAVDGLLGALSTLGMVDNPHVKHATKCGGCGLWFLGSDPQGSANLLRAHIYFSPCEHYANPTPLERKIRQNMNATAHGPPSTGGSTHSPVDGTKHYSQGPISSKR
jgi:hypothetical protein